jgi:hypothetical protein
MMVRWPGRLLAWPLLGCGGVCCLCAALGRRWVAIVALLSRLLPVWLWWLIWLSSPLILVLGGRSFWFIGWERDSLSGISAPGTRLALFLVAHTLWFLLQSSKICH